MKILAITQSSQISGGANRSFLDVLRRLRDEYSHEITVLVPEKGKFTDALSEMNMDYIVHPYYQTAFVSRGDVLDIYRHWKSIKKCILNSKAANCIIKKIKNKSFELVYINDTTNTVGYYIAEKMELPFVWHFRGYQSAIKKYIINESKLRKSKKGKIINISKAMFEYMERERRIPPYMMEVVYNGVENKAIEKKKTRENGFHCLECGHISEAKGQIDAVRALAIIVESGINDIFLHFAGSPSIEHGVSYRSVLERIIEEKGLVNNVIFEGEVINMPSLRSQMDIELVCSVCEPFGRVTVEGMQSGLPVIGSNTGGTPEIIIDGQNGLLYEQGNPESLAEAIIKLYKDVHLRNFMSKNAIEYTKNHFTMEKNVEEINRIICEMESK